MCSKKSDELHDDLVLLLRAVTGRRRPVLFRAAEAEVSFLVVCCFLYDIHVQLLRSQWSIRALS